jgi:nucleotide-binding universal stress UspA family protein
MTILAPIDFSAVTDRVFETAAALADSLRGRVVLLHVVPPSTASGSGTKPPVATEEAVTAGEQSAARQLGRYEKRLQLDKLSVTKMIVRGAPAPQILEWCGKLGASFVVMGSHGLGVPAGRLVGETTEGVLRKAPCPVIIVPHPKLSRSRPPWPERLAGSRSTD